MLLLFPFRKLRNIVLLFSTSVPLQPREVWDPTNKSQSLSQSFIDYDIPACFGVIPSDMDDASLASQDITSHVQFFSSENFIPLALALQSAQRDGHGAMTTTTLRTVANPLFGIEAGWEVSVTWVYLSRVPAWEAQLSPEMKVFIRSFYIESKMGKLLTTYFIKSPLLLSFQILWLSVVSFRPWCCLTMLRILGV